MAHPCLKNQPLTKQLHLIGQALHWDTSFDFPHMTTQSTNSQMNVFLVLYCPFIIHLILNGHKYSDWWQAGMSEWCEKQRHFSLYASEGEADMDAMGEWHWLSKWPHREEMQIVKDS